MSNRRILYVDHDELMLRSFINTFGEYFAISTVDCTNKAIDIIKRDQNVVILVIGENLEGESLKVFSDIVKAERDDVKIMLLVDGIEHDTLVMVINEIDNVDAVYLKPWDIQVDEIRSKLAWMFHEISA